MPCYPGTSPRRSISFLVDGNSHSTRSTREIYKNIKPLEIRFRYRKNKNSGRDGVRTKTHPISVLARSANLFKYWKGSFAQAILGLCKALNLFYIYPFSFLIVLLEFSSPTWCGEDSIIRSPHDSRQYAAFQLPNRLNVLVISDPKTHKAAAALDVLVGSNGDPENRPGLAHFLEHMLFLGTRKYPEPDAYQAFITKHAGQRNAYTGFAHTNYFFDVDKNHLCQALDRFGQFFIAPLFTEKYVERERSAVHAEFQSKKNHDSWRKMAVKKQQMNPHHPLSRFSVGTLETLADGPKESVRGELIALYKRYYSANLMTLAVLGKEPVEVLERWVREVFSEIPDRDAKAPRSAEPIFTSGQLPARITVQPIKEKRNLDLSFPIPALKTHYREKPVYYIAHLLGHEGRGSLLSLLKARGWAEALSAGPSHNHRDGALFTVSIALTKDGMNHIDAISGLVFQTIHLIETQGIDEWLFRELAQLANIEFLFQKRLSPIDYVSALANALHDYPSTDVLRGNFLLENYDPALIRRYLVALRPDNVLITVTNPDAQTTDGSWSATPWFEANYRSEDLEPALVDTWDRAPIGEQLAIPAPNAFIPEDLSLKPPDNPKDKPVRILNIPGLVVWFQQDTTYHMPRADFYFSVRSPVANDSPRHSILSNLLVALVKDQLTELTYPADLAGLDYELYPHIRGLSVRISGYHDKQGLLLGRILDTLRQPKWDQAEFAIIKDKLTRKLRNLQKRLPYRQGLSELQVLLLQPQWTPAARLAALEPITLSDLRQFASEFFRQAAIVVLSHGNIHRADALTMGNAVCKRLLQGASPTAVARGRVIRLPKGRSHLRRIEPDHHDNAVLLYLQGRRRGFRELAGMALLGQILKAPFFHRLRTEQQLGYVVTASSYPIMETPGLVFLVQSPDTTPEVLTHRIEQFLADGTDLLAAMTEAEFTRHQEALISVFLEPEKTLQARSDRYWQEIDQELDSFDSPQRKAAAARTLTPDVMKQLYQTLVQGEKQRRLLIQALGNRHREREEVGGTERATELATESVGKVVTIDDPDVFKQGQALFPEK